MSLVKLKDLHIAKIIKDDDTGTTYETPIKIKDLMTANLTPSIDTQNVYADDGVAEINTVFSQVEVEISVNEISSAHYAMLLGKTVNSEGVVIDSADDVAPYFALGYRAGKSGGRGDRLMWLYKGKFNPFEEEYATQGDSADSINQTISATFVKRQSDGKWRARVDSDDTGLATGVASNWFTKVYEEGSTV